MPKTKLHPELPTPDFEEVDVSLFNTLKRSTVLGYKLSNLALNRSVGVNLPGINSKAVNPNVNRHVELTPEHSLDIKTKDGSEHFVDIYGLDYLHANPDNLAPLVMIMPLSLPHNKGFQAPIIDSVASHSLSQGRSVLVISSEGFGDSAPPVSATANLDFDKMTDNIHEVLDIFEHRMYIEIPEFIAAGGSRGGTLSLLLGSQEAKIRRLASGRQDRRLTGFVSTAPAGLRPLDTLSKKLKVIKQFGINEPLHLVRKASSLSPDELEGYLKSLVESLPPSRAIPSIGRTALLFLTETPLEKIGQRLDPQTQGLVLVMNNDGITTPKHWQNEFSSMPGVNVIRLPGHHLSIDSIAKVAAYINYQLSLDQYNKSLKVAS